MGLWRLARQRARRVPSDWRHAFSRTPPRRRALIAIFMLLLAAGGVAANAAAASEPTGVPGTATAMPSTETAPASPTPLAPTRTAAALATHTAIALLTALRGVTQTPGTTRVPTATVLATPMQTAAATVAPGGSAIPARPTGSPVPVTPPAPPTPLAHAATITTIATASATATAPLIATVANRPIPPPGGGIIGGLAPPLASPTVTPPVTPHPTVTTATAQATAATGTAAGMMTATARATATAVGTPTATPPPRQTALAILGPPVRVQASPEDIANGASPSIAAVALRHLGEIVRPDGVPWAGWCEMFVDNVGAEAGITGARYANALSDLYAAPLFQGRAPAGSLVFFDERASVDGHVGIALGDGTMISALSAGIVRTTYENWPSYMGWRPYPGLGYGIAIRLGVLRQAVQRAIPDALIVAPLPADDSGEDMNEPIPPGPIP